jgi:hypothetical protein
VKSISLNPVVLIILAVLGLAAVSALKQESAAQAWQRENIERFAAAHQAGHCPDGSQCIFRHQLFPARYSDSTTSVDFPFSYPPN